MGPRLAPGPRGPVPRSTSTGGGSAAGGGAAANGASNGSTEHGSGWLGRVRGAGKSNAYSPPPLAGNQAKIAARGGLQRPTWRQEDFDAEMLEASLREQRAAGVGRPSPAGARGAAGEHPGGNGRADRRAWPTGAAASRLSGARGVDAGAEGVDPHACGGDPRGAARRRSPTARRQRRGSATQLSRRQRGRVRAGRTRRATPADPTSSRRRGRGRPRRPAKRQNGATKPREAQDQPPSSEGDR